MEFDAGSFQAAVIGGILTAGAGFAGRWLRGRRSAKTARVDDEKSAWQANAREHKELRDEVTRVQGALRADIRNVEGVVREIKGQVEILIGIVTRKG